MLFRLENRSSGQATHTGVLEFIADEGMAYIPYWVWPPLAMLEPKSQRGSDRIDIINESTGVSENGIWRQDDIKSLAALFLASISMK